MEERERKSGEFLFFCCLTRCLLHSCEDKRRRERNKSSINQTTSFTSCGFKWEEVEEEKIESSHSHSLLFLVKSRPYGTRGVKRFPRVFLFYSSYPNIAWVAREGLWNNVWWERRRRRKKRKRARASAKAKERSKQREGECIANLFLASQEPIRREWNCTGGIECDVHLRVEG